MSATNQTNPFAKCTIVQGEEKTKQFFGNVRIISATQKTSSSLTKMFVHFMVRSAALMSGVTKELMSGLLGTFQKSFQNHAIFVSVAIGLKTTLITNMFGGQTQMKNL